MTFDWQAILLLFKTQPALTAALAAFVVTGALQLAKKAGLGIVIGSAQKKLWVAFVASAVLAVAEQLLAWGGHGPFDVSELLVRLMIVFFGSGVIYRVAVKPVVSG